jgi:hypothetical protein
MQAKGGGKHDILSVGRATATTRECLWMRPRDPDADMCPGMETVPVSTEECMAHQSCVSATDTWQILDMVNLIGNCSRRAR